MFFEGFKLETVALSRGGMRLRRGGSGPPLLLLHGNPQTHVIWHKVAPVLARNYTVICPDLPGYGATFKPPVTADHAPYSKQAMAKDMAELMTHFGHASYAVIGHDRGGRLGHRIALDYPNAVTKLAVLDIVPTLEHFERADMQFGLGYYHWFWFAQPHPFPETLINASPEAWFRAHTSREPKPSDFFAPEAMADYLEHVRKPEMISGMCEDYRAAASIDLVDDRASRAAGDKIKCPLLVLWGEKGKIGKWYDALALWRLYCAKQVSGGSVPSGHYLAEESPDAVLAALKPFLAV